MFFALILLGLALWCGAHLLKPMFPERRAALDAKFGEKGARGIVALTILGSVILMGVGYEFTDLTYEELWIAPIWMKGINNLLMIPALALMGAGDTKSNLRRVTRHPMLAGFKLWAVAHLLVNGDVASVVMFGGLLAWAVIAMISLNKRDGAWEKPAPTPRANDVKLAVAVVVLYAVIVGIHMWTGVNPFS